MITCLQMEKGEVSSSNLIHLSNENLMQVSM